jgi:hypothetical protein
MILNIFLSGIVQKTNFPVICHHVKLIKQDSNEQKFLTKDNLKTSKLCANRRPNDTNETFPMKQHFAQKFKRW